MSGSGLMSKQQSRREHLVNRSGGLAAELGDLRADVVNQIGSLAAITVEEFTNPAGADTNAIKTSIASVAAAVDYSGAALNGAVGVGTMSPPRNATVSNDAGATPADAPASAHFYGKDITGADIDETITINQAGGTAVGAKAFAKVTRITMPAGDGTGALLEFGFGDKIGLAKKVLSRAGGTNLIREVYDGSLVTNGVLAAAATGAPNGTYLPNTVPNGTHDYAIYYEFDPTV